MKRRLESKTLLICRTDENRGVSPHSTAYYQSPYIHLRKGFFEQEAVGQAATMFHEASHAVGAPAPLDHDRKTDPLLSFRMQGGLAAFRWVRDPVYFCSWYCNYDDEGVKDAALTRILGLRLTLEHYSKTAEGRARLAVLDSLKAEIETFDYRAHAKKICHFDAAFPRDWFVPLPPL